MSEDLQIIQKVAKYFRVPLKNLQLDESKTVKCCLKNEDLSGFIAIANTLAKVSQTEMAQRSSRNFAIEVQICQWLEYIALYVISGLKDKEFSQKLLIDLNDIFRSKSYLVESFSTLADLVLFYAVHDFMKSLTPLEKRKYLNLSRWCNHIQQLEEICPQDEWINFNIIHVNL